MKSELEYNSATMSGRIPQHFIQDLISRTDLVEIVQARIALKRRGHNYLACCPFHNEKSPSFNVNQAKQFYYCFGCGAHGNVISFLMEYDRRDFLEIVHDLAAQAGLSLPEGTEQKENNSAELYPCLEIATQFYEQNLRQSPEAINYLKKRGLNGSTAKKFRIGYAPDRWDSLTLHCQGDAELQIQLAKNGLLINKEANHYYDRFRSRIQFPIRDLRGRVIAFGGRTMTNDPAKYLNSPETPIFHKGSELYGLYEVRQAHARLTRVLIVEGYMDVVSLAQYGVDYAVATLGTATSAKHIQKLLRYTQELIFCFDGDRAGRQAAWRALTVALPLMHDGVEARFMFLPDNEDPDSLIQKMGKAAFEQLMQKATPLATFFFNELKEQIPLLSIDSKARFSKEAHSYLDTIPKGLFQQLMVDQLAEVLGVKSTHDLSETPKITNNIKSTKLNKIPAALKLCLALLLEKPSLAESVPDLSHLDSLELPGKRLFLELLEYCRQKPNTSVGELLAESTDPSKSRFIAELSAWAHQVDEESLELAFKDALTRLEELSREQRINELITKSKSHPLNVDEKERLKAWLSSKAL